MYLLARLIYKMSSACLTVREAAFASSFKHALVISFINRRALEILGKDYRYLSHTDISLRMVEAVARHKNIQQGVFLGLWNFPMKNRSTMKE